LSPKWRWFLPGYVWALPHTLVGLLLAIFYKTRSWRWSSGCLEVIADRIIGNPAAQTHGWLIFYSNEETRELRRLRAHERVHVVQGFIGGPLYVLAYSASFLWHWIRLKLADASAPWLWAYQLNWFEDMAYRLEDEETAWS